METKERKQEKFAENKEVRRLSKIGEWLESGQSIGGTYDLKAILK